MRTNEGPEAIIRMMPMEAPIPEASIAISNADPARPDLASGCPSKQTTA